MIVCTVNIVHHLESRISRGVKTIWIRYSNYIMNSELRKRLTTIAAKQRKRANDSCVRAQTYWDLVKRFMIGLSERAGDGVARSAVIYRQQDNFSAPIWWWGKCIHKSTTAHPLDICSFDSFIHDVV